MKCILITLLVIFLTSGCMNNSTELIRNSPDPSSDSGAEVRIDILKRPGDNRFTSHAGIVANAERKATPQARQVMVASRKMIEKREIIRGGCWDYLDVAFTRAGYPRGKRITVFKRKKTGPYANPGLLEPGDWVYHTNHSYHGIEHSGMFIDWMDYGRKIALMLSYAGERRKEPARYRSYDLSNVYHIMRAR